MNKLPLDNPLKCYHDFEEDPECGMCGMTASQSEQMLLRERGALKEKIKSAELALEFYAKANDAVWMGDSGARARLELKVLRA